MAIVLDTFDVSYVLETLGAQEGINVITEGIDDLCYGVVIGGDQTFRQFLTKHRDVYDYLILDQIIGGSSQVSVIKRPINASFTTDLVIAEDECILADPTQPAIKLSRIDPLSVPREIEIQYIDPGANFATNTQLARQPGAPQHQGRRSMQVDFVLDAATARTLAFNVLARLWAQSLQLDFEHPDIRVEPADVVQINTNNQGTYFVQIVESLITKDKTNQLKGQTLLTQSTLQTLAGQRDPVTYLGGHNIASGVFP